MKGVRFKGEIDAKDVHKLQGVLEEIGVSTVCIFFKIISFIHFYAHKYRWAALWLV